LLVLLDYGPDFHAGKVSAKSARDLQLEGEIKNISLDP
jgi:hypothetical protein